MMNVIHESSRNEWSIKTDEALTDEAAAAITWRATPLQVTLGAFVKIEDAGGTRIGYVSKAEYFERWDGPAYVVVNIELL